MDKEAFQGLMDKLYKDTFTVEYVGDKYFFQKRYSSETTMKITDLKPQDKNVYLISCLLKEPLMSVEQVNLMPSDFINKAILAINKQTDLSGEERAELLKKAAASRT